jgi:hypothetical protein
MRYRDISKGAIRSRHINCHTRIQDVELLLFGGLNLFKNIYVSYIIINLSISRPHLL